MKKIVFFVVAMVAVAACGNMKGDAKGSGSGTLAKDSVADSVLLGDGESQSEVRVRVVFPVGDDLVAKNIRDFIREQLDSKNSADSRDVRKMVRGYVEESKKEMTAIHAQYEGSQKPGLSDFMDIDVLYEDEDFWKQQTAALPWVCVRAEGADANEILMRYNVQQLPTFFLVDRNSMLYKRDTQMKDFEAELRGLL